MSKLPVKNIAVVIGIFAIATAALFFINIPTADRQAGDGGQGNFSPFKLQTIGSGSYTTFKDNDWIFNIGSASAGLEVTASVSGRFIVGNTIASISQPFEVFKENSSASFELYASGSYGGCLVIKDVDGSGSTYCRASNGTLTCNTTSCR